MSYLSRVAKVFITPFSSTITYSTMFQVAAERMEVKLERLLKDKARGQNINGVYSVSMWPIADIWGGHSEVMQGLLTGIYQRCQDNGLNAQAAMTRDSGSKYLFRTSAITDFDIAGVDGIPITRAAQLHLALKERIDTDPTQPTKIAMKVPTY